MITTPELIDTLAGDLHPVRRMRPPLVRAMGFVLLAIAILALLAAVHGLRDDVERRFADPIFVITLGASLATAALAAVAVFFASQPDRSAGWLLLPLAPLALWISTVSYGCLTNWISIGPAGIRAGETVHCFATLLLVSIPLSLAMFTMVRRAVPFRPTLVSALGGIAVGGFAAVGVSLLHDLDASAMVLIWNFVTIALFAIAGGITGRRRFALPTMHGSGRKLAS